LNYCLIRQAYKIISYNWKFCPKNLNRKHILLKSDDDYVIWQIQKTKMTDYEKLRLEIQSWYPDEQFTDSQLSEMTDRLIKFFAIGAKVAQKDKRLQEIKKLHKSRNPVSNNAPKGTSGAIPKVVAAAGALIFMPRVIGEGAYAAGQAARALGGYLPKSIGSNPAISAISGMLRKKSAD
jgi:hypothetical protein